MLHAQPIGLAEDSRTRLLRKYYGVPGHALTSGGLQLELYEEDGLANHAS